MIEQLKDFFMLSSEIEERFKKLEGILCLGHSSPNVKAHIKNVMSHFVPGSILYIVATFHDVGKLEGNIGHEHRSARFFVEKVAALLRPHYTEGELTLIATLIQQHMQIPTLNPKDMPRRSRFLQSPRWANLELLLEFNEADSADCNFKAQNERVRALLCEYL